MLVVKRSRLGISYETVKISFPRKYDKINDNISTIIRNMAPWLRCEDADDVTLILRTSLVSVPWCVTLTRSLEELKQNPDMYIGIKKEK